MEIGLLIIDHFECLIPPTVVTKHVQNKIDDTTELENVSIGHKTDYYTEMPSTPNKIYEAIKDCECVRVIPNDEMLRLTR